MLKVLDIALSEVGYHEGAGNVNKYAERMDTLTGFYNGKKNGYAWCDIFVDYCFVAAYGVDMAQKLLCQPDYSAGAGCTYSAQYYKQAGRWRTEPEVGAQIFFGNSTECSHTGLVYVVDETKVYTVEGNSADMVMKREYRLSDTSICGYGMPDYALAESYAPVTDCAGETEYDDYAQAAALNWHEDGEYDPVVYATAAEEAEETATEGLIGAVTLCTAIVPVLCRGDLGKAVRAMQHLLILRGFTVGNYGPDGEFGTDTEKGLRCFQMAYGLEADCVCGALTWAKLIGGKV